jgi:hypothetical protein
MTQKELIWYGYPRSPTYRDIINLVLIYDGIFDGENILEDVLSISPNLAEILINLDNASKIKHDELLGHNYANAFLLISTIANYYGLDIKYLWTIPYHGKRYFNERLGLIDKLKSDKEKHSKKFVDILIPTLRRGHKKNPDAIEKTIETLNELPILLDKTIIKREGYENQIQKVKKKHADILFKAIDLDLEDQKFCSLIKDKDFEDPYWESFVINSQILQSSGMRMPLYMDDTHSDIVKYKFLRGADSIIDLKYRELFEEAYSVLIPEIYVTDIRDLIKLRNQKVFKEFRKETSNIIEECFDKPFSKSWLSEYLKEQYINELEEIAINRAPKPKKILLKTILTLLHPIISLTIGSRDVYEEYLHSYKKWRFTFSVVEIKDKIKKIDKFKN